MNAKSKGKILIADDEIDLRTLLTRVLANEGYDVKEASDGEEALKLIQIQKFDIAILDIKMPQVSGIEVLKKMQHTSPTTQSIMLTGYSDLKHAMEAQEYGAKEFIGKPYKIDDILSTVERLLKERS